MKRLRLGLRKIRAAHPIIDCCGRCAVMRWQNGYPDFPEVDHSYALQRKLRFPWSLACTWSSPSVNANALAGAHDCNIAGRSRVTDGGRSRNIASLFHDVLRLDIFRLPTLYFYGNNVWSITNVRPCFQVHHADNRRLCSQKDLSAFTGIGATPKAKGNLADR
jgi:hypothetical protein